MFQMFSLTFRDILLFMYINIVHMEVDDAVVSEKHHLC